MTLLKLEYRWPLTAFGLRLIPFIWVVSGIYSLIHGKSLYFNFSKDKSFFKNSIEKSFFSNTVFNTLPLFWHKHQLFKQGFIIISGNFANFSISNTFSKHLFKCCFENLVTVICTSQHIENSKTPEKKYDQPTVWSADQQSRVLSQVGLPNNDIDLPR